MSKRCGDVYAYDSYPSITPLGLLAGSVGGFVAGAFFSAMWGYVWGIGMGLVCGLAIFLFYLISDFLWDKYLYWIIIISFPILDSIKYKSNNLFCRIEFKWVRKTLTELDSIRVFYFTKLKFGILTNPICLILVLTSCTSSRWFNSFWWFNSQFVNLSILRIDRFILLTILKFLLLIEILPICGTSTNPPYLKF